MACSWCGKVATHSSSTSSRVLLFPRLPLGPASSSSSLVFPCPCMPGSLFLTFKASPTNVDTLPWILFHRSSSQPHVVGGGSGCGRPPFFGSCGPGVQGPIFFVKPQFYFLKPLRLYTCPMVQNEPCDFSSPRAHVLPSPSPFQPPCSPRVPPFFLTFGDKHAFGGGYHGPLIIMHTLLVSQCGVVCRQMGCFIADKCAQILTAQLPDGAHTLWGRIVTCFVGPLHVSLPHSVHTFWAFECRIVHTSFGCFIARWCEHTHVMDV